MEFFDKRAPRVEVVDHAKENDRLSSIIHKNLELSVFGSQVEAPQEDKGFHIVNVKSELLKRQSVLETMRKLGVCTCQRCQADVLALTLTKVTPKYCVMYENMESSMLSYYKQKYQDELNAAVVQACESVKKSPHH